MIKIILIKISNHEKFSIMKKLLFLLVTVLIATPLFSQTNFNGLNMNMGNLYRMSDVETRSISPENFTGEKGKGGMAMPDPNAPLNTANATNAARDLGQGWKVNPFIRIKPCETFTVEEASEWTALFDRSSGWVGADGIFTIPVNGIDKAGSADSTLFIFSDTMIGEIKGGELQPGWSMVNNSAGYLRGSEAREDRFRFYWNKNDKGKPQALFIPDTPSAEKGDYYWLGDGFVNAGHNNATYIFAYRMRNLSNEEWSFSEMGNVLIVIPPGSKPPFKNHRQIETPFHFDATRAEEKGSFGAGILVNTKTAGVENPDGYVYVYGVKGKSKQLLVARVLPKNFEDFGAWRFWDGNRWNADMYRSVPVAENVSNELSVSHLPDGQYALVYQEGGMGSTIGLRVGTTPYGPFGPQIDLWECKEPQQKNIITYNAKAHPALSRPGELLISYNVNAFDFLNEIKKKPNLYRPRFIRVRIGNEN